MGIKNSKSKKVGAIISDCVINHNINSPKLAMIGRIVTKWQPFFKIPADADQYLEILRYAFRTSPISYTFWESKMAIAVLNC